jgi:KTSC domain
MPSSVIANMVYDAPSATLRIVFVSGAEYEYRKVPATVYSAMQKAASKGSFLNNVIKKNYSFKKIK